jgi:aryl-alcohol dehydrogenase-like predicted oxidoreductase
MESIPAPMKRRFGRINFDVTTMALGGQSSIQWTPEDVEPVDIILKAFDLGINYFDTSNVYGPSQLNFGKAFRKLNLVPGQPSL